MNSSKPYGPLGRSTDFGGRGNTVRTANVAFPLTPTLSLGERENSPLSFSKTQRGFCSTNFPGNRSCCRLFPLAVGEGQGEGNRRGHPVYWTVHGIVHPRFNRKFKSKPI